MIKNITHVKNIYIYMLNWYKVLNHASEKVYFKATLLNEKQF